MDQPHRTLAGRAKRASRSISTSISRRAATAPAATGPGPRAGNWRVLRILKEFEVKVSVLGVVRALQQNPDALGAFVAQGHEIVSHGWRWIDYQTIDEAT